MAQGMAELTRGMSELQHELRVQGAKRETTGTTSTATALLANNNSISSALLEKRNLRTTRVVPPIRRGTGGARVSAL